jgi:hypothetical protein
MFKTQDLSQADRVLKLIKRSPGITNYQLAQTALKYSSRISELRQDGYGIRAVRVWKDGKATGTFRYYLEEENLYGDSE